MDMKSLLEKMNQLSADAPTKQIVTESEKEKKLPPWLKKDEKKDDVKKDDDDADDKEKVDEAISIQADGAEATSLLDILKLAGQPAPQATEPVPQATPDAEPMAMVIDAGNEMAEEEDPAYANTPDEKISGMSAAVPSGDDLSKSKTMMKHNYRGGDNPMAMREEVKKLEGKLAKMFESMSKE